MAYNFLQQLYTGTAKQNDQLVTNEGSVFGVNVQGADIAGGRELAYFMME